MMGISFFNLSGIFRIILLTQDVCAVCSVDHTSWIYCNVSNQAHHLPLTDISLPRGLQKVVPEFICIENCVVEPLILMNYYYLPMPPVCDTARGTSCSFILSDGY